MFLADRFGEFRSRPFIEQDNPIAICQQCARGSMARRERTFEIHDAACLFDDIAIAFPTGHEA